MADARVLHRVLLIGILVGIAFASYATFEVLDPALQTSCSVSSYFSCGAVDKSGHTTLLGIPDFAIGLGGFLAMLALDIPLLATYDRRLLGAIVLLSLGGLVIAAILGSIEIFVIKAICPICLGAYLSDAAVLAVSLKLWLMRRTGTAARDARPEAEAA